MATSVLNAPHFQNEDEAFAYVEARLWPNGPVCHHCKNADQARIKKMDGKTTRKGLYKCNECRKPFTVRMGTIFESSHLALHLWLQVIHLMCASKKGISTRQIQRMLDCSMKTAWFLTQRIRKAMEVKTFPGALGGQNKVVEADESYIGGKAKNRKNYVPVKQAGFALVERDGSVRSFHVPNVTGRTLKPIMKQHIDKKSYLMTDEATVYPPLARDVASGHGTVNHSAQEYVRAYFWHTNNAEGFFSILKRGITGVYHHVSEKHLHRYLSEFDFRHSNRERLGVNDVARADLALLGFAGKRLTYRTTTHC